jgi:Glycosyl transferase family 11
MVIPKFQGRLGNQLFQAAAAYATAKKYGDTCVLQANVEPIHEIFVHFERCKLPEDINVYNEPHWHYAPIECPWYNNQDHPNTLLSGYFQSIKHIDPYLEDFVKLLYFPEPLKEACYNISNNLNKFVVLHARRGDYRCYPNIHPVCGLNYFTEALKHFPNHKVVVCTDDQNDFNDECYGKFDYVFSNGSQMIDLYLMSLANGVIMSNSSFSWWGATIKNKDRTIIAPKTWFGSNGPKYWQNIYCDNWITQ